MAITSLDQVLAGMQPLQVCVKAASPITIIGRPQSFWAVAGAPGAGTFSGSAAGATYSQSGGLVAGAIPHFDPLGGTNAYLARFEAALSASSGQLLLLDRLWDDGGLSITSTAAQTINSVAWPARDNTGTNAGAGVLIAVELSAASGAGTPTFTLGYTNSAGNVTRTATNIDATQATSVAGGFYRFGLQAGDVGVQSIQTLTLSATWTSGTINLVAYRVLAALELPVALFPYAIDAVTSGMPQIFNGTTPFVVFVPVGAVATSLVCQYIETVG